MKRHLVILVAVTALLVAGCARSSPAPKAPPSSPVGQVRSVGALRVKLESLDRANGVIRVVLVTTNSSAATQPVWFEHIRPLLLDSHGDSVEQTITAGSGTYATGVTGGGLLSGGEPAIGSSGRIQVTATFPDPGAGAKLLYDPRYASPGRPESTTTVSWALP